MNYQMLLLGLAGLCVLLFLVQWIRQARHALHGGTRPLAQTHPVLNWCLLLVAVLAGAGGSISNTQTEAATSQAAQSSSIKARRTERGSSSSVAKQTVANTTNNNRQGEQKPTKQPVPDRQSIRLDQNGRAALNNFAVPAKNQLQVIDAGSGNVLQTFPGQPNAGAVNYSFTRAGNYYLVLTDGQQTKTIVVNVSR